MSIYLLNIIDSLNRIDRNLFILIQSMSFAALYWLMMVLRNALTWIPLYAFILFWLVRYQKKFAWQFIVLSLVVFTITDFTSASILKPLFLRPRPCADLALQGVVRDLVGCGGKYGMPSSHASNHFGLATFWYFSIKWMSNRKWLWLWLWAALVCYAQVYVGKHYPGDILAGSVLGTSVGFLFAMVFRKWLLKKDL
ncbi:MAG: phosphatase PAP2 family protein [Chitinophagaceae bacterium]|nr:phosphatase PAP2 family protein [Chitinophagaceae bacterium]